MTKKLVIVICIILYFGCREKKHTNKIPILSSGIIERIENFPTNLVSPRNIDIWLPPGYNKNEKYAVLYMHDGQMLFDSTTTWNRQEWGVDEVVGELIDSGKIRKTIVVGIWNSGKGRHADYFPQNPFLSLSQNFRDSLLNDMKQNQESSLFSNDIQSDNYLKFIVRELKPYVDLHYSTFRDRENTFIAGSSMGGLISLYAICEYPEVFGGTACLSTHWPGISEIQNNPVPYTFINYMKKNLPGPNSHKFYFDYGTKTLDSLYEPYQMQVDSVMVQAGYSKQNWLTLKFEGEEHSERSWNKRLEIPLIFLLRDDSTLKNN